MYYDNAMEWTLILSNATLPVEPLMVLKVMLKLIHKLISKPFDNNMKIMAKYLINQLRNENGGVLKMDMDISKEFNINCCGIIFINM